MFFAILWKLCTKYLPKQSPAFMNMPPGITEDSIKPEASSSALVGSDGMLLPTGISNCSYPICIPNVLFRLIVDANHLDGGIGDEDYQALTEREETDLERLFAQSDTALSNAEKFIEELAKDLSLLDGVSSTQLDSLSLFCAY